MGEGATRDVVSLRVLAGLLIVAALRAKAQTVSNSYVGSKACFGCHSAIYKSFAKTDMSRSITAAGEWKAASLPSQATIAQPGTSRTFSVLHNDAGWWQNESEPGVFSVDHQLEYVVGSGYNGMTFLVRRGRSLFQAPLSYYSRAQKWDLSPGYQQADLGFNRMVPEDCISCHAGRSSPLAHTFGAYADPPFQELAIGCENCHGPGEAHVKGLGKSAGTIVNPAKLATGLADNICLSCHQAGGARVTQPGRTYRDFRPGQWLFDTAVIFKPPATSGEQQTDLQTDLLEHYSAMQASRCFRESAGKLGCLSCHDPHVQPRDKEVATYYRPKCLTCHSEQSCRVPSTIRAAKTPPDDCVGCHMPKRDVTQVSHSALTNHRIPARPGEPLTDFKQVEQDGLVVVNPPGERRLQLPRLMLLRAYQQLAQDNPIYQHSYGTVLDELSKSEPHDVFVQAALGDRAFSENRTEDAIAHFKLAMPQVNPATYLELGQSLAKLGRSQEAIEYLKTGVELDSYNATMQKTLILQYINLKSYAEARLQMEQYVVNFPEDSFMRSLLARVSK